MSIGQQPIDPGYDCHSLLLNKSIFCNLPKGSNCEWNLFLARHQTQHWIELIISCFMFSELLHQPAIKWKFWWRILWKCIPTRAQCQRDQHNQILVKISKSQSNICSSILESSSRILAQTLRNMKKMVYLWFHGCEPCKLQRLAKKGESHCNSLSG